MLIKAASTVTMAIDGRSSSLMSVCHSQLPYSSTARGRLLPSNRSSCISMASADGTPNMGGSSVQLGTSVIKKRSCSTWSSSSMSAMVTELEREQGRPDSTAELPGRWRQMAGEGDWEGLLDPMDPLLRQELVRYGEMTQACYDAFDFDRFSKYCGACKLNRRRFFDSLGLPNQGSYEVTRYLYATAAAYLPNFIKQSRHSKLWSRPGNWMGYVAVSGDDSAVKLGRRDITVAWRGTVTRLEWVADLTDFLKPISADGIPCPDETVKVESGFIDLYTGKDPGCRFCKYSAREQVLTEVSKLVKLYTGKGEEVSITVIGHSLGSALATLNAFDIAETGANIGSDGVAAPVCVYSFAGPRVGNVRFRERFEEELRIKALRVVNMHDSVPKVPGVIFNERVPPTVAKVVERVVPWWCYTHVGVELRMDHKKSPFLKETNDISCYHNLEAHLHLLDGYGGEGRKFALTSGRDPALVNKSCDFLKEHHLVPPCWRQDENKGMVMKEGKWVKPDRPKLEDHPEDMQLHLKRLGLQQ